MPIGTGDRSGHDSVARVRSVQELFRLDESVALVTGGAGHIALACEEALAEMGVSAIVIADRDGSAAERRALELQARFGIACAAVVTDFEQPDTCASLVSRTVEQFGRLDVLVNNAAYTGASGVKGYAVPFPDQTLEAWEAALRVNLSAPFALCQAAFAELAKRRGAIVNVGSIYGSVGPKNSLYEGTTMGNPAAYGATKGGLAQLTRYLATVMAPHVRVNTLSPGGVLRGQPDAFRARYEESTPLGRMATEEDFKGAFAYLASPASAYVTGQNLLVDGGWTAW